MSVYASQSEARTNGAALELARAMATGLEMHRSSVLGDKLCPKVSAHLERTTPLFVATLPSVRPLLDPYCNTLGHPATARPGLFSQAIRLARRGLKAFIRPWLELQTRFNHATIASLENSTGAIQARFDQLATRLNENSELLARLCRNIEECYNALQQQRNELDLRVDDCHHRMHLWRETLEARIAESCNSVQHLRQQDTVDILEQTFVNARLPAPPAKVLELTGADRDNTLDRTALGYQVVRVDPDRCCPGRGEAAALPFADNHFDAVVNLATLGHPHDGSGSFERKWVSEITRVLRPGGRLLVTLSVDETDPLGRTAIHERACLESFLQPLHVVERVYGVRSGSCWWFSAEGSRIGNAVQDDHVNMLALVLAEKS